MINPLITFSFASTVFAVGLASIIKYVKLIPVLLVLSLISVLSPGASIVLASAVSSIVLGYFTRLMRRSIKQSVIPLTLLSLSLFAVVMYRNSSAYLFTLFTGIGASAGVGIAYAILMLGEGNIPPTLKHLLSLRFSVEPERIANYLAITVLSAALTLLVNELGGRGYAALSGFLAPFGLYAYFRLVRNRYALLTVYFAGAALTWLALTNAGINSLNNWFKFFNEVILTWEKNAL